MKKRSVKAFTLVEVLVASSIFVLVVGFSFELYSTITRVHRTSLRAQRIYSESRFWMDMLTNSIQGGRLYYSSEAGSPDCPDPYPNAVPETRLRLLLSTGEQACFFSDGVALKRLIMTPVLGSPETLTAPDIIIPELKFYISPPTQTATKVPMVTILWEATDNYAGAPVVVNLQTTVSLRNF